ncbi:hypothetical protein [Streptomyces sp. MA15]|uniref:hypothetical protein n=1 Tax=Streptomyces sp. MA15 TaxID=3055061 RepID=UPI0025B102E5|nr:hypothetical protein [Streptomyces sp. MA15]MDN3270996.1 hypothetical protein [Streptomyces sp. MA15]
MFALFTLASVAFGEERGSSSYGSSSYGSSGDDDVSHRGPDGLRRLQVYEAEERSPEESFDLYLSDRTPKADGFEKVALAPLETEGVSGLRLEYRADSLRGGPDVGSWHVQDARFRSPADGKVYAIAAYGAPRTASTPNSPWSSRRSPTSAPVGAVPVALTEAGPPAARFR